MTTDTELLARLNKEFPPDKMAQESLAFYMTFVHRESDMPEVAAGALAPQPHHMKMIEALEDGFFGLG